MNDVARASLIRRLRAFVVRVVVAAGARFGAPPRGGRDGRLDAGYARRGIETIRVMW